MKSSLAEQLAAVIAYRNEPDHKPEPIKSNWSVVPANDNKAQVAEVDYSFERNLLVTPSVKEIMRQVEDGPVVRNDDGQIVAIGRLKFSDGTQTERAYTQGPDGELIQYDRRMEAGAMLHTVEKPHVAAGGRGFTDTDLHNSNAYYAHLLGTSPARYVRRTKRGRMSPLNAEQSRALLDEAIANTKVMPEVTKLPPGLPCGAERIGDCFVGHLKSGGGNGGSIAWEDIGQTVENAKLWKKVRQALKTKDLAVIDAAVTAQTLEDVGLAAGQSSNYAKYRGGGRRALIAANDNLKRAINRYSSGNV